ncbi:MAG: tape measure protein [Sphingomonas sp.]
MKLSLIIDANARGGKRGVDSMTHAVSGLDKAAKQASRGVATMDRSITKATGAANRLERAGYKIGYGIGAGVRTSISALGKLDRRLSLTRQQMGNVASWAGGVVGTGVRVGVLGAVGAVTAGLYEVVTAGLQFEKFRTQLTGLEGSVAAGNKSMQWVTDFARTTPFQLAETMEAFVKLRSYGIDPMDGSLRNLGDTAAGMGASLDQAVEMMADAQTFQFERLRSFGVTASQKGDQVTFAYVRNGKSMVRVAKKTAADVSRALNSIFGEKFAGATQRLAQTTAGKWSNVMDRMTISAKRVWEGGFGSSVNTQLDRFSSWVDTLEKNGSLAKWSSETGKGLGDLVAGFGDLDWAQAGRDVASLAASVHDLATSLRSLPDFSGVRSVFSGLGDKLSFGGKGLFRYFGEKGQALMSSGIPSGGLRMDAPPPRYWDRQPAPRLAPPRAAPPARPNSSARSAAPVGKISLHVTTDAGVKVKPTKVAANGMDLDVNTGRAMASFA